MDWIRSFYDKQHEYASVCAGDIAERLHLLEKVCLSFRGLRGFRYSIETVGRSDVAPAALGPCR